MKFGLVFVIIAILIALCQPQITFSGAVSGLNIWFFQLLPTLLPFMILSNILLSDPVQEYIFARMSPLRAKKIRILFAVLAGLTFGLPIGAKMAKDLYQKNLIDAREGQILLNHCNLIGPSFVGSYVLTKKLDLPDLFGISLLLLYLPHILCLVCFFSKKEATTEQKIHITSYGKTTRKATPRLRNCFQILNVAIMNGFETITILGGYLILFGIFCAFVKEIQFLPTGLRACILAFLEITIGIHEISILEISGMVKYLGAIPLLSFGGLCTAMQTWSVCMGAPFSMRNYIKERLLFALISGLLTILYFFILY